VSNTVNRRERWGKSIHQLPWFLDQADQAVIFDNSDARPQQIGLKRDGRITIDPSVPSALLTAIERFARPPSP
jgi:predicted ABC-type ATPase